MGDECGTFFRSLLCNFLICCWVTCNIKSNLLIIISYWLFHIIISLFPICKVRVETDIKERHLSETSKNDLVIAWNDEIDTCAICRVRTLLSSSKFHDFPWLFPWPFQVFQDLRFSCQFQKFKNFPCFTVFSWPWTVQPTQTLASSKNVCGLYLITPLYLPFHLR